MIYFVSAKDGFPQVPMPEFNALREENPGVLYQRNHPELYREVSPEEYMQAKIELERRSQQA